MKKLLFLFLIILLVFESLAQSYSPTELNSGFNNKLLVAGHRGGFDNTLPENSVTLFDNLYKEACQKPIAFEFDIRESASGTLFIMHDSTINRTTSGSGKINELSDMYLNSLFLKDRNGIITSEKIPLFENVLTHFSDKNVVLMLDVKGKILQKVIQAVKKYNLESKCIVLTFAVENTLLVKSLSGTIKISAWIPSQKEWEVIQQLQFPNNQLIAYVSTNTSEELINQMRTKNVIIMTDMSETALNNGMAYEQDHYLRQVDEKHLGIIITDFPIVVSHYFCDGK